MEFAKTIDHVLIVEGNSGYGSAHSTADEAQILSRQIGNNIELSGELTEDHLDQRQHQ